jgi:exodeoxyribonuclease V alpha subunit
MTEKIQGQVERITYVNEENGYSVIKVKVPGRRDLVNVVGNFISITPGEVLRLEGSWGVHKRFGEQFNVDHYETLTPATVEGIKKYLGSGLIKGIGPVMAKRITNHFGEDTLEIIENQAERLRIIEGIGPYRAEQIKKAWEDQKDIREVMIFLKTHGVHTGFGTRIFKHYGKESLEILKENPYRLAMEISGIGFISADKIAQNLGFSKDSPLRAEAGILYVTHESTQEGHVCLPRRYLTEQCEKLLEIPSAVLEEALLRLFNSHRVVIENIPETAHEIWGDTQVVYLRGYHLAETQVAQRLLHLGAYAHLQRKVDIPKVLDWLRKELPIELAPQQEEAVKSALTHKVMIITGGPGTGKTTLIRAILSIYKQFGSRICLAAPTGRAAKRLSEAAHHPAKTIHRLLEYKFQAGGFQRNEERPLNADLVIVDEASMLDNLLMYYLLKAVPPHATLILVGDVDQLPSVGAGSVLHDIIDSQQFPVVWLTEIFRQARRSRIVVNAHLVLEGKFPRLHNESEHLQDFYFIEKEDSEEVLDIISKLCKERIPARFGLDPVDEIQVLTPMHRGIIGAQNLNTVLQNTLNPQTQGIERGGQLFRIHDKVMQIRNDYDKDVFNGDLGRIVRIDMENQEVHVDVDGRLVIYDFSELDQLVLAYAISVHKAQGSEYPAVVIPLLTQHYVMLQRNLLYTAITRGKKLVVIVGTKKALGIAIGNDKTQKRFTLLKERLCGQFV